jgi:tripartite-type tricarboxylate transporter receptor subunit TctC
MTIITRLLACGAVVLATGTAWAQGGPGGYPNRPVKVVVPFAAAGPTDVMARLIAQKLSENLGQQFYVENQAGAGGNIGMSAVAKAAGDGYTMIVVSSSFTVNPSLYSRKPYDPFKDFAPVTMAAASPNILAVHPSVPAKSVKELVDLMKADPSKFSIANPGIGTTPHLAAELFKLSLKIDLAMVPFRGAGPAVQSAVAGHTPVAFTALPPTAVQVKEGKLRGLAVTGAKRSAALPDVPTIAEAGMSNQESETMQGILLPAAASKDLVTFLNREIIKVMALPDVKQKAAALGFDVVANTPEQFTTYIKADIEKWAKVIKDAKIAQIE